MADQDRDVTGGVDNHKDLHVAAVIDAIGRILATASFAATPSGYRRLLAWMRTFGRVTRVGVEGTGAYGAGLARYLATAQIDVVEVNRPNRQARGRRGKNDTVDAEAAARAALNVGAATIPKSTDGVVEAIRAVRVAFTSMRDTRTRFANQVRDLIITAPEQLRAALEPLETAARVERCAWFRPGQLSDPAEATKGALRALARQYQALTVEMDSLRHELDRLTIEANPALRAANGVGVDVASILLIAAGDNPDRLSSDDAFAAMCGASPVEASTGKVVRHRLNQGGNRQGNHALWRIVMVGLTCDPATKAYAQRRRAEGKSTREIIRYLKRCVAREIYQLLTHPQPVIDPAELRSARLAAGITLATAAEHLGTWSTRIVPPSSHAELRVDTIEDHAGGEELGGVEHLVDKLIEPTVVGFVERLLVGDPRQPVAHELAVHRTVKLRAIDGHGRGRLVPADQPDQDTPTDEAVVGAGVEDDEFALERGADIVGLASLAQTGSDEDLHGHLPVRVADVRRRSRTLRRGSDIGRSAGSVCRWPTRPTGATAIHVAGLAVTPHTYGRSPCHPSR
jgi:transposase